jgi:hypothetical protein
VGRGCLYTPPPPMGKSNGRQDRGRGIQWLQGEGVMPPPC